METNARLLSYRRAWWAFLIRGMFALALGVFILTRPLESVAAFALVVALWALFGGIVESIHAIELRHLFGSWWVLLLSGLIGIGFGIAALIDYPGLSLLFAVVWVSLWLLSTGLVGSYGAWQLRRAGLHWGWTGVWSVLSIVAGIVVWLSVAATLAAIMGLIAGFAILSGLALVFAAYRVRTHHEVLPR
jgi:uncharacterized membrane protein HdeD (DUF308 family)